MNSLGYPYWVLKEKKRFCKGGGGKRENEGRELAEVIMRMVGRMWMRLLGVECRATRLT